MDIALFIATVISRS